MSALRIIALIAFIAGLVIPGTIGAVCFIAAFSVAIVHTFGWAGVALVAVFILGLCGLGVLAWDASR